MEKYSVKQVARLAKVSVRTLHLYDEIGLLKPETRTTAGYRLYGEKQLLRLQQILFYREMELPLEQIRLLLDDPGFNLVQALNDHKAALKAKSKRIQSMLKTIDKTIDHLNHKVMLNHHELYEGFSKEEADIMHNQAVEKYGEEAVNRSESALSQMSKADFKALQQEQKDITNALLALMHEEPESAAVQFEIGRHYQNIRYFWGTANSTDKQAKAYAGLGELYVSDERFTTINGKPNPGFAQFLSKAMSYYAENSLK